MFFNSNNKLKKFLKAYNQADEQSFIANRIAVMDTAAVLCEGFIEEEEAILSAYKKVSKDPRGLRKYAVKLSWTKEWLLKQEEAVINTNNRLRRKFPFCSR